MNTRTILPAVKTTSNRKPLLVALSIALLLVAGSILLMSSDDMIGPDRTAKATVSDPGRSAPSAGREAKKTSQAQPSLVSEQETHGLGYSRGDFLRFRFERQRDVTISAMATPSVEGMVGETQSVNMIDSTSGILSLKVYEELESGWALGFEFSEVRSIVKSSELGDPRSNENLQEEMNAEILVLVESSGRFAKVVFPASTGPDARNSMKDLLAHFQIILPDDRTQTEWEVEEEDTTGTYLATYRKNSEDHLVALLKTRLGYTYVETPEATGQSLDSMTESSGQTEIQLDPHPVSIIGEQRLSIELNGLAQGVNSVITCRFERLDTSRRSYPASAPATNNLLAATGTNLRADTEQETGKLALAADLPDTVEILRNIRTIIAESGIRSTDATAAMAQLVEAMKRDDKAVKAALDKLAEGSCGEAEASILIGAMGAAGTAAAQEALQQIITSESETFERRETALFAFAQVESPIEGIDETLRNTYEEKSELWNTSLLLLGAVGGRVRDTDPGRFDGTADYLLEAYKAAGERGERAAALESIGNLGLEVTPPEIARAYADSSDRIRRAAVRSLRKTFDPAAEEILSHAFNSDPSETVRAAAAKILAEFPHETNDHFLRAALPGESSSQVRRELLAGLARRDPGDGSARDLVEWMAGNDPSNNIREYAEKLLR